MIVDGVPYTAAQIRAMVRERENLTLEVALCRDSFMGKSAEVRRLERKVAELTDTLTKRSAALNRVAAENDRLRA